LNLDESSVKNYFKKEKTVSRWWEPEKLGLFHDLYVKQRHLVNEFFDAKDKIILDAGTGKGRFAIDFSKGGAKKVYAIDLSSDMLTIARRRAEEHSVDKSILFQIMDIENLKYSDNFFDVTCCMETFVHLPSPHKAMNELARVVKPGGLVIGSVTLPLTRWYLNLKNVSNFNQLFEWSFTPIYQSKLYQNWIRRIFRRPSLVGRPLSSKYFSKLFIDSKLSIQKQIYLGHPRAPHFLLIVAQK
jgi:ubiquinone/menaquinone biosynthesis C-methylase UbiE